MIVALFRSSVVRVVAVGMMLLALQNTLFADMRPAGVSLQVMLAFAAAAGAAGGSERGATAGFVLGLLYDLGTGGPLGSSSITMGLAGYVAGYVSLINVERQWWLAAAFVAVGAAVGELGVPIVRSFIGDANVYSSRLYVDRAARRVRGRGRQPGPRSRQPLVPAPGDDRVEGAGRMNRRRENGARASFGAGLPDWAHGC